MRHAAFGACLLSALALAAAASAGGQTVRTVMRGTCTQANRLDANGALLSLTLTCTASAACACEGSTKLAYSSEAHLRGNGAPGRESGSLVASGPTGSVTLLFSGTRTALGQGSGTWTLGEGDRLPRRQAREARQLHDADEDPPVGHGDDEHRRQRHRLLRLLELRRLSGEPGCRHRRGCATVEAWGASRPAPPAHSGG